MNEVTFIIPNYNYGRYIGSCISSVAKQWKFKPSIIVYDDHSDDDSVSVVENSFVFHEKHFSSTSLVRGEKNRGKIHGLNKMIPMVKTPLTVILDADDVVSPMFLNELIPVLNKNIEKNHNTAFVYTDCIMIDGFGNFIGNGSSEEFCKEKLLSSSYIPENALTRTDVLRETLPMDESIMVGTKHHKWLKIISNGHEGIYHKTPLFEYRMHSDNISSIGNRITSEIRLGGRSERILSDYWLAT